MRSFSQARVEVPGHRVINPLTHVFRATLTPSQNTMANRQASQRPGAGAAKVCQFKLVLLGSFDDRHRVVVVVGDETLVFNEVVASDQTGCDSLCQIRNYSQ